MADWADDIAAKLDLHLACTQYDYCEAAIADALRTEREATARRCAEMADKISADKWDLYKRGAGPERADPHFQGLSDGAEEVSQAIRVEFGLAPDPKGSGEPQG